MRPAFALTDPAALAEVISAAPLASVVSQGPEGLQVSHLPLHLRGGRLVGHVARNNPLLRRERSPRPRSRRAADGYVSPSLYPGKPEHGRVVPTWNYVVAHAHGALKAIDDPAWIRAQLEALTDSREGAREHPWAVGDAPADYLGKMLRAIVGIEIAIARLEGVRKASQNREERDRASVKAAFTASPEGEAMARWM